jgi:hypothetical protein
MRPLYLIAALVLAATALLACGDDDSAPAPSETEGVSPTPEPLFKTASTEALRQYLLNEGIEGETGELTEPVDCTALHDGFDGDYCVFPSSLYAPALAVILVGDADSPNDNAWQVRVVLEGEEWRVTEVVSQSSD